MGLDRSKNEDNCPKQLLDEIGWYQFQGIFEHADFNAKGKKILFELLFKVFHIF